jgi:hypothetical protein
MQNIDFLALIDHETKKLGFADEIGGGLAFYVAEPSKFDFFKLEQFAMFLYGLGEVKKPMLVINVKILKPLTSYVKVDLRPICQFENRF